MTERVRNLQAAAVQITAEQLLNEARVQFQHLNDVTAVKGGLGAVVGGVTILDRDELRDYLQRKRKEFEEKLRSPYVGAKHYLQYAKFEAENDDYKRARSVLERGLLKYGNDPKFWMAYGELEAKGGFTGHALNVLQRATRHLPRVEGLWFKYLFYQQASAAERGEDDSATRAIFNEWMEWKPSEDAWFAFLEFEDRAGGEERARDVYERFCGNFPTAKSYCRYAKWEEIHKRPEQARRVFERAVGVARARGGGAGGGGTMPAELPRTELTTRPDVWLAFAAFEAKQGEIERARAIYRFALSDALAGGDGETTTSTAEAAREARNRVLGSYAIFEKKSGNNQDEAIDYVVAERRRRVYTDALASDPRDYDAWFDLIRLERDAITSAVAASAEEETVSSAVAKLRGLFARAQAESVPEGEGEKTPAWRRYVYLFIYEALFEETMMEDLERAREAYAKGLRAVPHKRFTFGKLWILAAQLEVRAFRDLGRARGLLGRAIGACPKDKVFRHYIQMELRLKQVERCRILYEKYLAWSPVNAEVWAKYAELEAALGEEARARAVFELGVQQPVLNEPEKLWTRYVEFEAGRGEVERARALYERLVTLTEGHQPRVWIAYAKFEGLGLGTVRGEPTRAREVLVRGENALKSRPEARAGLLKAWMALEETMAEAFPGSPSVGGVHLERARANLPTLVSGEEEDGEEAEPQWRFPADEAAAEAEAKAKQKKGTKRRLEGVEEARERKGAAESGVEGGVEEEEEEEEEEEAKVSPMMLKMLQQAERWKAAMQKAKEEEG